MQMRRGFTPTTRRSSAQRVSDTDDDVGTYMPTPHGTKRVHVIEAQYLFIPALIDVFAEAGLVVESVASTIDPRKLLADDPDIVFLDADFMDEPVEGVRLAHVLLPEARICVYASSTGDMRNRAFIAAGATVVLEKSAERSDVVRSLRRAITGEV
jgi:DNA-binding NarL/FixJ family response regulator